MSSSPHDALFKWVFSDPVHAASWLRSLLPPELTERIDWSALEAVPISFVDDELAERYADLLFATRIGDRQAWIYFLCEHQSSVDPWMPLRLLDYCVRAWNAFRRAHPDEKRLPAIVPVVLHHSAHGWKASTRFSDLLDLDDAARTALMPHLVDFGFVLDDLSRQSDEQLQRRALTQLARVVALSFKHLPYVQDPLPLLERLMTLMREVVAAPGGKAALNAVVSYVLRVADVDTSALKRVVGRTLGRAAEENIMSTADRLIEQGLIRGRAEGRVEGETRGRAETLLKLLRLRFGELSPAVIERVRTASIDELDRWAEHILSATSVNDTLR